MRWNVLIIAISVVLCGGCGSATHNTASLGAGNAVHEAAAIQGIDDAARLSDDAARWAEEAARWADDPARREADDAAKWVDDAARREAEREAPRLADDRAWQGADEAAHAAEIEVTVRSEVLKSKIENSIEYVKTGGCAIVEYAGMEGVPPSDEQVHYMVESYVPQTFTVESGGVHILWTDDQVESELIEINHLVWDDLSSAEEPDDYFDVLFEVSEKACKVKDVLEQF